MAKPTVLLLFCLMSTAGCWAQEESLSSPSTAEQNSEEFRQFLSKLSLAPATRCEAAKNGDADPRELESSLSDSAMKIVLSTLNSGGSQQVPAGEKATTVL